MISAEFISLLAQKRSEILNLGLSLLFFVVCIIHLAFIVLGRNIEAMWMIFGSLAMILLLLNCEKNLVSIFLIVIFGTFVADEEFLLEVAAISSGEALSAIRESRNFEVLTVKPQSEIDSALTDKLKQLLQSDKTPEQIIEALETYRSSLEIAADVPGFEAVDKDVVAQFYQQGTMEEGLFFEQLQNKGYSVNDISDAFEKLGAAEYIANHPNNVNQAQLTEKGIALAKFLGFNKHP